MIWLWRAIPTLIFLAAATGCSDQEEIAKLEKERQVFIGVQLGFLDKEARAKDEGLDECMAGLLGLDPATKARLRLDLLNFTNNQTFNAEKMAEADVAAGNLNVLTGGLSRWYGEPAKIMRDKYGIHVIDIASCTDGKAIFRLMDAYNSVSLKAIEIKHGAGFIEKFFAEDAGTTMPASAPVANSP